MMALGWGRWAVSQKPKLIRSCHRQQKKGAIRDFSLVGIWFPLSNQAMKKETPSIERL